MIFSDAELRALAERVGNALSARSASVATAESCTGGWIAKALTDAPGASGWFQGGWVVYANEAKMRLLGVPAQTLAAHGAVSEPVVRALAEAARTRLDSDFAIAVSGVAGPAGGSAAKPVGLVWLAWASRAGTSAERRQFAGDRDAVRRQSVAVALARLLELASDA